MAKKQSVNPTRREERNQRRQRERRQKYLRYAGLAVLGLVVIGVLAWFGTRPATAMGEGVTVTSRDHVAEGTETGPYQTDPPTGGKHYPGTYRPGFYNEGDLESLPKPHEGYLVHNLEHGYVIFWYNCSADPNLDCEELKQTIRQVMDQSGSDELIAFPWESLDEPLAMTSWDRIMCFDQPDPAQMSQFVRLYLNKSPEAYAK